MQEKKMIRMNQKSSNCSEQLGARSWARKYPQGETCLVEWKLKLNRPQKAEEKETNWRRRELPREEQDLTQRTRRNASPIGYNRMREELNMQIREKWSNALGLGIWTRWEKEQAKASSTIYAIQWKRASPRTRLYRWSLLEQNEKLEGVTFGTNSEHWVGHIWNKMTCMSGSQS